MPGIVKYIPLLFVLLFTGIFIAKYYYVCVSIRQANKQLLRYALIFSFLCDIMLFLGIVVIPITCVMLIILLKLSFSLAWLVSAYWLCGLTSLCFIGIFIIKQINYRNLNLTFEAFRYYILFHLLNIIAIVSLLITLHDAVMQKALLIL